MKDTLASQSFLCFIVVEVSQHPSTMNTLNVAQFSPFNRRLRKCSGSGSSYVHPFSRQRAWLCAQRLFFPSPPPPPSPSLDRRRAQPATGILITFTVHSSLSPSSSGIIWLGTRTRKRGFPPSFSLVGERGVACLPDPASPMHEKKRVFHVYIEVSPRASGWKREQAGFRVAEEQDVVDVCPRNWRRFCDQNFNAGPPAWKLVSRSVVDCEIWNDTNPLFSFLLSLSTCVYIYVRKIDDDNLTIATEKFTTRIGDGTYLIRENWKLNREWIKDLE